MRHGTEVTGHRWNAADSVTALRIAAVKYRRFAALHTWRNKLMGGAIFLVPYTLGFSFCTAYCRGVCALALAAATEELIIHLRRGEYCPDAKSLFIK